MSVSSSDLAQLYPLDKLRPENLEQLAREAQIEEVAKAKTPDLTAADLEAAVRTIAGSARSMGVDVEGF